MTKKKAEPDFSDIKEAAAGRWLEVLGQLAPALDDAIKAHRKKGQHVPCPLHGGKDGFRLFDDAPQTGGGVCNSCGPHPDGIALLTWLTGKTPHDVFIEVSEYLGVEPRQSRPGESTPPRRAYRFGYLLRESLPLTDPGAAIGRRYLAGRGLAELIETDPPPGLRFSPRHDYWALSSDHSDPQKIASPPALLVGVHSPLGDLVGIHQTWLRADGTGKADLDPNRKMRAIERGATNRGAARLYPLQGAAMGICEGIETSLAVRTARPDLAIWAGLTAGNLARFEPPSEINEIFIFADHDQAGITASTQLAERCHAQGLSVWLVTPPPGMDWLDVLEARL